MCLTRRDMIAGSAVLMELLQSAADGSPLPHEAHSHTEVGKVDEVAPGVYFHEGDLAKQGHCNNGWIIFDDYVLVIDANFPSGAQTIIPKIRALTDKPVRFAF